MEFVAVDFETANAQRGSICAVGIVVVSHGEIIERFRRLVRPYDGRFDDRNIFIHGITPQDVKSAPNIEEIWPTLASYFSGLPVIAHNASFDMSALRYALDHFDIAYPTVDYACTRLISQRVWPGLLSYSLTLVARHLSIGFKHHDPLEDAATCAQIASRACQRLAVSDIRDLSTKCGAGLGHLWPDHYATPVCSPLSPLPDSSSSDPAPNPSHPFFAKTVVFTGNLQSMSRKQAWRYVDTVGGTHLDVMNNSVDILVVGDMDFRTFQSGHTKSGKIRKAEDMLTKGIPIQIMSEDDFLQML